MSLKGTDKWRRDFFSQSAQAVLRSANSQFNGSIFFVISRLHTTKVLACRRCLPHAITGGKGLKKALPQTDCLYMTAIRNSRITIRMLVSPLDRQSSTAVTGFVHCRVPGGSLAVDTQSRLSAVKPEL